VLPPTGQREERDSGWQQPGTAAGGDAEELPRRETLGNRLDKRTGDPMLDLAGPLALIGAAAIGLQLAIVTASTNQVIADA
jgi:hypothetical protein